ncbi:DNA methylase N-4/N-6 domain-containing protein [Burkholderia pseudomallei]|nr:DNA methylase N-4/N-6 domain-containing protein [Burkholderia pseudomallei]
MRKKTVQLSVEYRPVELLIPYARNARVHSDAQIAQIAASLREFGWTSPVLVDGENGIIAGHGRVLAARKLDMSEVPVIELAHLSEAQRRAYVIADNRLALDAGWDKELLALEIADLDAMGFNVDLIGFTDKELMAYKPQPEPEDDAGDEVPEPPLKAVTIPGDIWQLGRHRILCGDCRDPQNVARLLGDTSINLAFTSPPYAEQREYDEHSGFRPIHPDNYVDWFAPVAANVAAHLAPDGSWFVNIKPAAEGLDTSLYVFDLVITHVRKWGWHFATEFCWERSGVPKQVVRRFKNQFEPVYQFTRGDWKIRPDAVRHPSDSVPKPRGKGAGNTAWGNHQGGGLESIHMSGKQGEPGFKWFGDDYEEIGLAYPGNRLPTFASTHTALGHSAAFPVGLPDWFIRAYTDEGDAVFDPFSGSGSTIIAAQNTGRLGYGIELSPVYTDVIVRRWQNVTGHAAVLDGDGRTFDAIAAERVEVTA